MCMTSDQSLDLKRGMRMEFLSTLWLFLFDIVANSQLAASNPNWKSACMRSVSQQDLPTWVPSTYLHVQRPTLYIYMLYISRFPSAGIPLLLNPSKCSTSANPETINSAAQTGEGRGTG